MKEGAVSKGNIRQLMDRVRSEVQENLKEEPAECNQQKWGIKNEPNSFSVGSLLYSEELNFINANWNNWYTEPEITSHRLILGKYIVAVKNYFIDLLWNKYLKHYFKSEASFHRNLVIHLNSTARYIDARDSEIFWQLVKKIDNDISGVNERTDLLFNQGLSRTVDNISNLSSRLEFLEREIKRVNVSLDILLDDLDRRKQSISVPELYGYQDLANYFANSEHLVIDVGCEGAEFLEMLKSNGVEGLGVTFDNSVHQSCIQDGVNVVYAVDWRYLEKLEDAALSGMLLERIEQWASPVEFDSIVALARKKIISGGLIVIEASSNKSDFNISNEEIQKVFANHGIIVQSIDKYAGLSAGHRLNPIELGDFLPQRWKTYFKVINDNIRLLNRRFFKASRLAVVGVVGAHN